MSSMSESTWTAAVAGRPPNRARHERLLRMFVRIEPGEARCFLLFFVYAFLVLVSWYIVRTLREPLLLVGASPEVKTYASAAAALALLILVPLYGAAFRRAERNQLVRWVTGFFVASLGVLYLAARSGADIGFVYYVWVGVLGVTIVAQFWAHAADCFDVETGKRLFPAIMAGATLGGIAGPSIYGALHGVFDAPQLMLVAIVLLAATVPLVEWTRSSVPASRRGSVAASSAPRGETNLFGGFSLIARDRYLLLVALLVVVLNCVNTMGEYLLSSLVVSQADLRVASDPSLDKGQLIGEFYASFYLAMNLLTVFLQVFLVGRLFRWIGVNGALLVLPLVALIGYGLVVFVPVFALLRAVKICECAGNYSILNTARQALFLPLSTSGKYEGKIAADTFFWRFGDLIPAVIVFIGLNWLGFEAQQFAIVNIGLSLAWLAVTWKLARHAPERAEFPAARPRANRALSAYVRRLPTLALAPRASGWIAVAVGFVAMAGSAPADAAGDGAMASDSSSAPTRCIVSRRRVEVVGPVGLEPTTKGFTSPAVSGGSGLSLHPPTAYRVGCGTLAPVIKSTAALR
jgi:AAA family ATP:ADP antiporter